MKLYKYFDPGKFELAFKDEGIRLRVSQIAVLNDPFESRINNYRNLKTTMEKEYSKRKGKNPQKNINLRKKLKNKLNSDIEKKILE
ncbi:hypothetical protein [Marinomonas primoryensis]|uniref:hypothetical protein n=1 Tax=Marinomonas primoryensis TaxID=178399 RepID=UPI0037042FA3